MGLGTKTRIERFLILLNGRKYRREECSHKASFNRVTIACYSQAAIWQFGSRWSSNFLHVNYAWTCRRHRTDRLATANATLFPVLLSQ